MATAETHHDGAGVPDVDVRDVAVTASASTDVDAVQPRTLTHVPSTTTVPVPTLHTVSPGKKMLRRNTFSAATAAASALGTAVSSRSPRRDGTVGARPRNRRGRAKRSTRLHQALAFLSNIPMASEYSVNGVGGTGGANTSDSEDSTASGGHRCGVCCLLFPPFPSVFPSPTTNGLD